MLHRPRIQHLHQLLHRVLRRKQLPLRCRLPKPLAQARLHRPGMHGNTHGIVLHREAQVIVETLGQLRDRRFRRAIREPPALRIVVANRADARTHVRPDGAGRQTGWLLVVAGAFARQKGPEVLGQQHGTDGVDAEAEQRIVVVDLVGRFLGKEDAGDAEAEVEVVLFGREEFGYLALCFCD